MIAPSAEISGRHCRLETPRQDAPTEIIRDRDQVVPSPILDQQIGSIGLPLLFWRARLDLVFRSCGKRLLPDFLNKPFSVELIVDKNSFFEEWSI